MLSVSEEGPRVRADQILNARERVQRSTYEGEERQKTGRLMEKSVFETKFADQPEVLRRAQYKTSRVKENGKYVVSSSRRSTIKSTASITSSSGRAMSSSTSRTLTLAS